MCSRLREAVRVLPDGACFVTGRFFDSPRSRFTQDRSHATNVTGGPRQALLIVINRSTDGRGLTVGRGLRCSISRDHPEKRAVSCDAAPDITRSKVACPFYPNTSKEQTRSQSYLAGACGFCKLREPITGTCPPRGRRNRTKLGNAPEPDFPFPASPTNRRHL